MSQSSETNENSLNMTAVGGKLWSVKGCATEMDNSFSSEVWLDILCHENRDSPTN